VAARGSRMSHRQLVSPLLVWSWLWLGRARTAAAPGTPSCRRGTWRIIVLAPCPGDGRPELRGGQAAEDSLEPALVDAMAIYLHARTT